MAVDPTSATFRQIIAYINANCPDVASAVEVLESTTYNITDPGDIATYLAYSKLGVQNTNPDGTQKTQKQPTNIGTIMSIPTGIAGMVSLAGPKAGGSVAGAVGPTILAAVMQYEVFDRSEKVAEVSNTGNIAMLGGLFGAAVFATMMFLSKIFPLLYNFVPIANTFNWTNTLAMSGNTYSWKLAADANALLHFHHAALVAAAITTAVMAAGIIAGKMGQDQAPATPQASVVNGFLKQIPKWSSLLPTNAMASVVAGAAMVTSGFNVVPQGQSNQFQSPTVTLIGEIGGTTQDGASMIGKILVTTDPNGGPDIVSLVYPGSDGSSKGISFALDTNGYIIGPNGPSTSDLPFFQPIVDGTGKVTGVKQNYGALQALLNIPACIGVANSPHANAREREAALETCMRQNKDVQFIAMVSGGT